MSNHDRYDMDILKQLTKIANNLDRIGKIMELLESRYSSEDAKNNNVFDEKTEGFESIDD